MIEKSLVNDFGLAIHSKGRQIRKVYSVNHPLSQEEIDSIPRWLNFHIPKGVQVFEAFEFKVEFVNKDLFLLICPTIHLQTTTGEEPERKIVQDITNTITSNRWNAKFGKKVDFWFKELNDKSHKFVYKFVSQVRLQFNLLV